MLINKKNDDKTEQLPIFKCDSLRTKCTFPSLLVFSQKQVRLEFQSKQSSSRFLLVPVESSNIGLWWRERSYWIFFVLFSRFGNEVFHRGGLILSGGAVGAQKTPSQEQQCPSPPPNIQRSTQLSLLSIYQHRVVEIPYDNACCPGNRNDAEDSADDQHHTCCHRSPRLCPLLWNEVGALSTNESYEETNDACDDGNQHQSTGPLQVRAQCQHGVVHLTLHLACTLDNAAHPDALPHDLRCHNIAAYEGTDPPHRWAAGYDRPNPAEDRQDAASHLHAHGSHRLASLSDSDRILTADQAFVHHLKQDEKNGRCKEEGIKCQWRLALQDSFRPETIKVGLRLNAYHGKNLFVSTLNVVNKVFTINANDSSWTY